MSYVSGDPINRLVRQLQGTDKISKMARQGEAEETRGYTGYLTDQPAPFPGSSAAAWSGT